ncbi:RHS repeat-associated core domain-containing protein, partial [Pseudomonas helleri]|uniref:RHS repeat-associated core domain-containing protein n=1 Tax=Pseudomonas helleri TaxID=1608996 RepID=UPI003FD0AC07
HYLLGQGYREFNPVLMRFNSPDSWSPFGDGGINAYAYCDNDPLNKVDPTGHIPNIWKGLKNIFGRVPKRLRPSKVAATSAPSSQAVSSAIGRPAQLRALPREMLRRPNFNTEIPPTINHDVTRQATKNTVALMSTLAIEKPALSLQVLAA